MVKDLLEHIKVTIKSLKEVVNGAPLMILAWRRMNARLILKNERELYLKSSPHLRVSYVEKWRSIILHARGGTSHYPLSQTLKELNKH